MATAKPGKVSKNQRGGVKQAPRVTLCAAGHVMTNVLVFGAGMRWLCACVSYAAINASLPYAQIKAREPIGKAGMPRKDKGSYPQGSK